MSGKTFKHIVELINIKTKEIHRFGDIPDACKFLNIDKSTFMNSLYFYGCFNEYQIDILSKIDYELKSKLEDTVEDLPGEIWKSVGIKFFQDAYSISNYGRVKSFYAKDNILKSPFKSRDFLCIELCYKGLQKAFGLAKLVLYTFNPSQIKNNRVQYKDNNPKNITLSNLMWEKELYKDFTNEEWKIIPNYSTYFVSNFGRIRRGNYILAQNICNLYYHVRIQNDKGQWKTEKVHRLVAKAFFNESYNESEMDELVVNHLDGNKLNNKVTNLEFTDTRGNVLHAYRTGLTPNAHYRYIEYKNFIFTFYTSSEIRDIKEFEDMTDDKINLYTNSERLYKDKYFFFDDNYTPFISQIKNLPGEEWKTIKGYENRYSISSKGRLKSLAFQRNDYLIDNKNAKKYLGKNIFQLMAESFSGIELKYVYFKDGNDKNISLENLLFNEMPILENELWVKISTIWIDNLSEGLLNKLSNYEISSFGRIRFLNNFQMRIIPAEMYKNELSFKTTYKGKQYGIPLERLMLLSFSPIESCKCYDDYLIYKIIFINNNEYNLENLKWERIDLNETWKMIPNFSNYKISNLGNIMNINGKMLNKIFNKKSGYFTVEIMQDDGKEKIIPIFNLVALAFLGTTPKDKIVTHIDGNKLNDNLDNLAFTTRKELSRKLHKEKRFSNSRFIYVEYNNFIFIFVSYMEIIETLLELELTINRIRSYMNSGHVYNGFKFFDENFVPHEWINCKDGEVWKSIPGFENEYLISNFGRLMHYLRNGREILLNIEPVIKLPGRGKVSFLQLLIETFTNPEDEVSAIYLKTNNYKLNDMIFGNTPNYKNEYWRIINVDWILEKYKKEYNTFYLSLVQDYLQNMYEISSYGRTRYILNNRYYFRKPVIYNGYEIFTSTYKGRTFTFNFTELMLRTFNPMKFTKNEIWTIKYFDGNLLNNNINNLRWEYLGTLKND